MIHVYNVACSQEENGQKPKEESQSLKPKIDALRKNFDMVSILDEKNTILMFINCFL